MSDAVVGPARVAPERIVHLLTLFRFALAHFRPAQRRRVRLAAVASAGIALLDLAGVVLVGALVAVAIARAEGSQQASLALLQGISGGWLLALGLVGIALLVGRSVIAWRLNRRILRYIARRETEVAVDLLRRVQTAPFEEMSGITTQQIVEGIRWGSRGIAGIVCYSVFAIGEITLLVLMAALLVVVDPLLCLALAAFLTSVVISTARITSARLRACGEQIGAGAVVVGEVIAESVGLSRETRIYELGDVEGRRLAAGQTTFTEGYAEQQSWGQYPRYALEIALVLCVGIIVLVLWARGANSSHALTHTAIFIAASGRILPALLRLQNDLAAVRGYEGQLLPARTILALSEQRALAGPGTTIDTGAEVAPPRVELCGVIYRYPGAASEALAGITLTLPAGRRTALVGSTGAGKSTLADVLLGLLEPVSGSVSWKVPPGRGVQLAFVPQDVFLVAGSVAENVALGTPPEHIDVDAVWAALASAHLSAVVESQPRGIWTTVGERGVRLSGGQRQRLGIARALFRQPSLLILDEATSSLDAATEHELAAVLNDLRDRVTTIVIAHRLVTVRDADLVVLLSEGRIMATGSFDEVVAADPDFAHAASLQGLS